MLSGHKSFSCHWSDPAKRRFVGGFFPDFFNAHTVACHDTVSYKHTNALPIYLTRTLTRNASPIVLVYGFVLPVLAQARMFRSLCM